MNRWGRFGLDTAEDSTDLRQSQVMLFAAAAMKLENIPSREAKSAGNSFQNVLTQMLNIKITLQGSSEMSRGKIGSY